MELKLEGAAVLEVVEGAVEGPGLAALRLGVQRVAARVELRALLRVRQHLPHTRPLSACAHLMPLALGAHSPSGSELNRQTWAYTLHC